MSNFFFLCFPMKFLCNFDKNWVSTMPNFAFGSLFSFFAGNLSERHNARPKWPTQAV